MTTDGAIVGDDRGSAEAGVVRGIARSVGRQAVKLPSVGRLPRAHHRFPVQKVAKISDRMSTGWGVWDSAIESEGVWKVSRLRKFVTNLVKNTLLGAAVFETYGYTVKQLALPQPVDDQAGDEYARATVPTHFVAGALGGTVHGIIGTIWEIVVQERTFQTMPKMTFHHSLAHASLFGSYEVWKRLVLGTSGLDIGSELHQGTTYLGSVSIAGGLAGQVQHVVSHYSEQWLRLEEGDSIALRRGAPAMRQVWLAFPPSAVAFVAFEYGRRL